MGVSHPKLLWYGYVDDDARGAYLIVVWEAELGSTVRALWDVPQSTQTGVSRHEFLRYDVGDGGGDARGAYPTMFG